MHDYTASGNAHTISLLNANDVETVVNDSSLHNLTFSNVGSTLQAVGVASTDFNTTVTFAAGADVAELDLVLEAAGQGARDTTVTIDGVETVNVLSLVDDNAVKLDLAAATALTVEGDADLQLRLAAATNGVSSVDASLFEGNLDLLVTAQTQVLSTTDISVTSGQGNDTIDVSLVSQDYIVTLGAGDDAVIDSGITNNDSIIGGEGTDTLVTTSAAALDLNTTNGVNGIDVLELRTALNGALTTATVDSTINTVSLASTDGALNAAGASITGPAGELTVNLGSSVAGALAVDLVVTDTGTGITDTLNINNLSADANNTQRNVFAGKNVTSTGYENVNVNTGNASPVAQVIDVLTITADAASAPVSLTLEGQSPVQIATVSTNSTGLTTIDASGLSVLTANAGLTLGSNIVVGTAQGYLGTASITGSAGADTVYVGNYASTIDGGAGNDTLVGGTVADSIHGGVGNDNLTGAGGNDTIHGNEGNDTITATVASATRAVVIDGGAGNDTVNLAATLVTTDDVDGGEGTDTLQISSTAGATAALGVTNFEVLQTAAADQIMTNFVNNTGFTTVFATGAGVDITNASTTLNTYRVNSTSTGDHSFARLADTGTDSLTVVNYAATGGPGNTTLASFTADMEESLTIDVSAGATTDAGALTFTALNAADLTSLTVTGDHSVTINSIVGAEDLATINASGMTNASATLSVDASVSAVDMTVTAGSSAFASMITGSGDDSVTGSSGADTIWTNNGDDTVVANGGADVIRTDGGSDVISDGAGADSIDSGTGADSITLAADGNADQVRQLSTDSVAVSTSSFALATVSAGDSMTFGNGVDVVNNFTAGAAGDTLQVLVAGAPTTLIGQTVLNLSAGNAVFFASGNYNAATGKFTITANGTGADTLILQSTGAGASDALTTNASGLVLVGVDSADLVAGNFVGGATAVYTITANSVVTSTTGAISGGAVSAANLLSLGYTTIDGTGAFVLTVDGTGEAGNLSFNRATGVYTGATNASVNQLLYTNVDAVNFGTGADTYTTDSLAAGTTTVSGGTGVDTVVYTGGAQTINLVNGQNATGDVMLGANTFEQINASGATGVVTATLQAASTTYSSSTSGDTVNVGASDVTVTDNTATAGTLVLATGNAANTVTVNGTVGTLNAGTLNSALVVNLADDAGNAIGVTTGTANTSVLNGQDGDAVTVTAANMADNTLLTLGGIADFTVNATQANITINNTVTNAAAAVVIATANATDSTQTITNNGAAGATIDAELSADEETLVLAGSGAGTLTVNNLIANLSDTTTAARTLNVTLDDDGGVAAVTVTVTSTNAAAGMGIATGTLSTGDTITLAGASGLKTVTTTAAVSNANVSIAATNTGTTRLVTDDGSFILDVAAGAGNVTVDGGLADGETITLTGASTAQITVNTLGAADFDGNNTPYTGNVILNGVGDAASHNLIVMGNGTNEIHYSAAALTADDTVTGGTGADTLYLSVGGDVGGANVSAINTIDVDYATAATFTTGAMALTSATITARNSDAATTINAASFDATTSLIINDSAFSDTINTPTDGERALTTVNLSTGNDTLVFTNTGGVTANAQGATVNGFTTGTGAGADVVNLTLAGYNLVTAAATAVAGANYVENITSAVASVSDLTDASNGGLVEVALAASLGTYGGGNNTNFYAVIYGSGADAGMAALYEVAVTTAATGITTGNIAVEILGVFNTVTADSFVLGNFI